MPIYSSTLASSGGSNVLSIQTIVSDRTLSTWEAYNFYSVDTTANNITVTLPASTSTNIGRSICIKKVNNSNNFVKIVASGTDLLEGTLGGSIYLYNQGDSVTICSVNGDSKIINNSRNSVGYSMSYLRAYTQLNVSQSIGLNANIVFPTVEATQGNNISYDYTTGIVTLTPNVTYRLRGFLGYVNYSAQEGYGVLQFYNITTNQPVGCQATLVNVNRNINESKTPMAEYTFTPNVQTSIALRLVSGTTGISTIQGNWLEVEEISRQSTVINTVENISLSKSTTTSLTGVATDIIFDKVAGNMTYFPSTGLVSLNAGKTYLIQAGARQLNTSVSCDFYIVDSSNNYLNGANYIGSASTSNAVGNSTISMIYTPPSNVQIKMRSNTSTGSFGGNQTWMNITQLGSTAQTNSGFKMTQIANYATVNATTTANSTIWTGTYTNTYSNVHLQGHFTAYNSGTSALMNFLVKVDGNTAQTISFPINSNTNQTTIPINIVCSLASGVHTITIVQGTVACITDTNSRICLVAHECL